MISGRIERSQETSRTTQGGSLPVDASGSVGEVFKPCRHPGCRALVAHGRCPVHQPLADQARGTASERGYDADWQRFREWFVHRHPLCADCEATGIVEATEEVHHIRKVKNFPELRLVESNCMGLCKTCHSIRTRRGE